MVRISIVGWAFVNTKRGGASSEYCCLMLCPANLCLKGRHKHIYIVALNGRCFLFGYIAQFEGKNVVKWKSRVSNVCYCKPIF